MAGKLLEAAARVPGLRPHERCVLWSLAHRANITTRECWPSVARIASDIGMSEREVHRSLKRLRKLHLVTVVGKTKHGVNRHRLNLDIDQTGKSKSKTPPAGHVTSADKAADPCQSASPALTDSHTNKVDEEGQEQGHELLKTSTANAVLVSEEGKSEEKQSGKPLPKDSPPPVALDPLPETKGDSKLVATWKSAVASKGLTVTATAQDGLNLKQLAKHLGYANTLALIPFVVNDWTRFTTNCRIYAGAFSLPTHPTIGFLLRYRDTAFDMLAMELKRQEADGLAQKQREAAEQIAAEEWAMKEKWVNAKLAEVPSREARCALLQCADSELDSLEAQFGQVTNAFRQQFLCISVGQLDMKNAAAWLSKQPKTVKEWLTTQPPQDVKQGIADATVQFKEYLLTIAKRNPLNELG